MSVPPMRPRAKIGIVILLSAPKALRIDQHTVSTRPRAPVRGRLPRKRRQARSGSADAPKTRPDCPSDAFATAASLAESWVAGRGIVLYPGVAVDGGGTGESTGIPG